MNFNKPFLIALLFCLFTKIAIAKNYYFSTKFGNDSYNSIQAQNPSTPWKTLIKLNSFFFDINPGDSILFKRGEVFDGSIKISKSGTSMLPIVLGAYGKGAKPVINGLTTLTVWTKIDKGIYQSRCPFCKVNDNMVLINGTPRAIGRWPNSDSPNKGYLTIESHEGKISITGNGLTGTHDWIGAELVLRKNHYIIDRRTIASQSGNSLTFSSGSNYAIQNGFGFFIQNDPRTLDQLGEWYFDPTQKNMEIYFGSKDPSLYLIRTSIVDTLVYIDRNNYITIDDISFEGANMKSFCILSSSHITIQNCRFDFSGADAIFGAKSSYIYLKSNTINHSNNNAILIGDYAKTDKSNNIYVGNNTIKNTATLAGMGLKVDEQNDQNAIFIIGANCIVENNVIDSTGYIPIWHLGKNFLVQRNFITNFCFVKDDGGGTYSNNYGDDHIEHSNQRILFNIILNGIGASAGAPKNAGTGVGASGIYLDVNSSFDSVIGNTIGNCMLFGLLISDDFNVTVRNNTIYNCHSQMIIFSDAYPNASHTNNLEIKNNIFVAKTLDQLLVNYNSMFNDIDSFGIIDSNYYVRPLRKNKYVFYKVVDGISNNRAYTLKSWQNRYGYDIHSKESPIVVNPYTYITIGTNKFSNGTFNNNINGISYFDGGGGASLHLCALRWKLGPRRE